MYLARRLKYFPSNKSVRSIANSNSKHYTSSSSTSSEERIEIPNRIQRSSTDILQALASTVGRDSTAPHYKFHDDPYLTPMSNVAKRTFALSQEAGRKAAHWIKQEHRDLFLHQEAQPAIKEFAPRMVYNEESEVDQTTLKQLITLGEVKDAVLVYNLLQKNNIEVNGELKQSLLELVCFYNNQEQLSEEFIEERWFQQNVSMRERHRKTWKDGELAEQLFNEIEPKQAQTYAALIRGMAKYYQSERAYTLLQEAIEKQCELDTETFNAILTNANFLRESAEQRWELCRDLLHQMSQQKLRPNLGTLNGLLECISTFGNYKYARSSALKVLAEFKKLGVQPSLGTYYYVLIIFCRDRAPVSHVIVDILNEISGKEFSIEHAKDTFFFTTAMDVCRNHLHDKSLAKKVDTLLHTGKNYDLIGDSFKESVYYRHYLALLCQTESIEEFMRNYDLLVPNIYTPEPGIMEEILKTVEVNAAIELMPRLWSDMVIFDHTNRESLLLRVLRILIDNKPNVEVVTQQNLPEQFAKIALDIYNKIEESVKRVKHVSFTGQMIGDILTLLVRGDNFEKAVVVFDHIDKNQHRIPGTPSEASLLEFIEACIKNKSPSQALNAVEYAVDNSMETNAMASKLHNGFTLNEMHLSKLKALVGDSFLKD